MTLALPQDKLVDLRNTIDKFWAKSRVTKRELQSLVGKLNWASVVIPWGRSFSRRLIDRILQLRAPAHRTRVTKDMRLDLNWWANALRCCNGHREMIDSRPALPLSIDACNAAAWAYFAGMPLYTPFHQWAESEHVNAKEILALLPPAGWFGHLWTGKKIFVHSDNQCAVAVINRGSSRNPLVMQCLRHIAQLSHMFDFTVKAVYIPGSSNVIADCVSRLHEPGSARRLWAAIHRSCV